ncbi:vWA domain-containing protein [Furfurilactobacillus curtus]|uniref:VWA-like domain-containing protein n=1 Tax=Furfurilactobacillus curtus TaxID=1746200 RepID=A0ABQ5JQB4_9LACO
MANLDQQLHHLQQNSVRTGDSEPFVSDLLATFMREQPFYGHLLVQLPRRYESTASTLFALGWQGPQLGLLINDRCWSTVVNVDEIQAMLIHLSLHLLWEHPLRYAFEADVATVAIATDVAVNQMMNHPLPQTWTLAALNQQLGRHLPANADSQLYLKALRESSSQSADPDSSADAKQAKFNDSLSRQPTAVSQRRNGRHRLDQIKSITSQLVDDPSTWQTLSHHNNQQANEQIYCLLRQALAQTTSVQRGRLPSTVTAQISRLRHRWQNQPWQAWLARLTGSMPLGQQTSYARFNRRQPYRMELPGQLQRRVAELVIAVDESASIDLDTLTTFLTTVQAIMRATPASITVLFFDADVQRSVTLAAGQIKLPTDFFRRQVGGGTRFQAIFDYLASQVKWEQPPIVLVLTDGQGESVITAEGFTRVLWLVTAGHELSVQSPPGWVFPLTRDGGEIK